MAWSRRRKYQELNPDEIFLDSQNLPDFNTQQFEGRLEKAISRKTIFLSLGVCLAVILLFIGRVGYLQAIQGGYYAERSRNNSLNLTTIFPERGNIYDRNSVELAWNDKVRKYALDEATGQILGYLAYPTKADMATGRYEPKELIGKDGAEKVFNELLSGTKGMKMEEVNARGELESDHIVKQAISGKDIHLSIDLRVQDKLYQTIKSVAADRGFLGGGGIIMDVRTGEVLALASFPGYDSNAISAGQDSIKIKQYLTDTRNPLLNRVISGLYTPGSIFKPFIAIGALTEKTIDPSKIIVSTGELAVPNPYDPTQKTIFKDWKAHGPVDMRRAIAVSSNVYFYEVGGGFGNQKGLGIKNIEKYALLFGLSQKTDINLPGEETGIIPSEEWKAKNFPGEPWRVGDTYHTAIGQYGVMITPIQIARAFGAIANGGQLVQPTILKIAAGQAAVRASLPISPADLQIIREGMRLCALEGTAAGLNISNLAVGAKTGTAELGVTKEKVNSWATGFFPYDNPHYVFAVVMEKGERSNTIGGVYVMRQVLDWIVQNTPEYTK